MKKIRTGPYYSRDVEMLDELFSDSLVLLETDSGLASLNSTQRSEKNHNEMVNNDPFDSYILLPSQSNRKRPLDAIIPSEPTENVVSCLEPFEKDLCPNVEKKIRVERDPAQDEMEAEKAVKKICTPKTNLEEIYEKKIKYLISSIFRSMASKPEPNRNFDDFLNPEGKL